MTRKIIFIATIQLFGILLISSHTLAQSSNAESCIQSMMQENKIVGLSVAVVKKNRIIYTHSFGYKDLETKTPLTDDCIFRIASISKSFSATSIMQLVEAGKVSLDDDMSRLAGFTVRNPAYPETVITLRMVLSHRSSINDSQGYFTLDAINPSKNKDWAKCYNAYAPGTDYQYCNLNYNMVGTIIEKLSGERFDVYVRKHILQPMGLYGGYCVDSLDRNRFASLYEYNGDSARFIPSPEAYNPRREQLASYVMGYSTPIFSPTGGMKISAHDLAEYMIMHMKLGKNKGKRIISKKHALEMQSKLSEKEGYGMAIMNKDNIIAGKTMRGHTGVAYGLYSAMFWQPSEKFGFVVISNGCDPKYIDGLNGIMRKSIDCLYKCFISKQ
jgi:CubicO group peptidase (beta-lactamase class C family)